MGMDVELATHSVYDTHLLGCKLPEKQRLCLFLLLRF